MPGPDSSLKAVVLIGGPGTRLRPLTYDTPKSMVPVLNKPFMEHTIAYLKQFGIKDIILTLSYLPDVIREYFGDGSRHGVRLTYCLEEEPLGTAGAVKNAEKYLDSAFVVLNGDIFTDMDISDMVARHRKKESAATISLIWVDNPSAFGVVETDSDQRIKSFVEKPPLEEATTNWINAGTYILEPEVLEHIPPNSHFMFEKGLFPLLLNTGKPVYGYPFQGYWLDMGNPEKYFSLSRSLLLSETNSALTGGHIKQGIFRDEDVNIDPTARISAPVIIDRGCQIGRGVQINGPVVIGKDCRIDSGAVIENAILWNDVNIGADARLSHCIISSNMEIKPGSQIADRVVTPSIKATLA